MKRDIYTHKEAASEITKQLPLTPDTKILDLGCGDAVFLVAVGEHLKAKYPEHFSNPDALAHALTGVEVRPEKAQAAIRRLNGCFGSPASGWDIRVVDALDLPEGEYFDSVVGNPPWVRLHDLGLRQRDSLRRSFSSANGQFDLSFLFVEKAVRMLRSDGLVVLVVPRGIGMQPAGRALREYLASKGIWTMQEGPSNLFRSRAGVDAGILVFQKCEPTKDERQPPSTQLRTTLEITSGVATGADRVFLVDGPTIEAHGLEHEATLPALRGRDISSQGQNPVNLARRIIWPYSWTGETWGLADLHQWPAVMEYLLRYKDSLQARPRLKATLHRSPDQWARFIDARRHRPTGPGARFIVPDIFREPAYARVEDPTVVTMNTAFEIRPSASAERQVEAALDDSAFWRLLADRSRRLGSGYRRASVTEWRVALRDAVAV